MGWAGYFDSFGVAGFIIKIDGATRNKFLVVGGNRKSARMPGHFKSIFAVGPGCNLIGGIGGCPHLRSDGIPSRGGDFATNGCGVGWGAGCWVARIKKYCG